MTDSFSDLPCACTTLRKASRALSRAYDEALADTGLTINQFSILRTLEREGDMALSRLAEAMVMDRTSLYRALGPLERSGWVGIQDADSGKARIAALTPGGRDAIAAAFPLWTAAQGRMLATMGADGWSALSATLQNLTRAAARATR
jgi:DNA-binding MarR family transcriptional regulator